MDLFNEITGTIIDISLASFIAAVEEILNK